jgi:hypothetical protein
MARSGGLGTNRLIKLLVTLKCLLPVIRPAKTPTYLKRVVKEKWDEVNRLRKRRVRWTIGGDKIDVEYDVGINTAALPTVNALFHSIVSTHSHLIYRQRKHTFNRFIK